MRILFFSFYVRLAYLFVLELETVALKGPETPHRPELISCGKVKHESFPMFFLNHWITSYANLKNNDERGEHGGSSLQ